MFPFFIYLPLQFKLHLTMKKLLLSLLALASIMLQARPINQETARNLAQSFVTANFAITRQSTDLTLVHTAFSDRGEACYYIFNVGETGFVIFAADDRYRPVIGYSDEGNFDINDMAPALADYLEGIRQGVMTATQSPTARGMPNTLCKPSGTRTILTITIVLQRRAARADIAMQAAWQRQPPN